MHRFIPFFFLVLFSSCHTKHLSEIILFNGVIKTCVLDSTALTYQTTVEIVQQQKYFPNSACPNKPDYASHISWPSNIFLDFKSKSYFFRHSPVPDSININYRLEKYMTLWHEDYGTLKLKNGILTLKSSKHIWQRSYLLKWSNNKDTLTLTEFKEHKH
jgi:hypothetical protein